MSTIQIKAVMKGPNEIVPFDHKYISYPQYASQKYDGFRMLNLCGERLLSPKLKEIPNINLRRHLDDLLNYCFNERVVTDGEIWSPQLKFDELKSIIRSGSADIPGHVFYHIFDMIREDDWNNGTEAGFAQRYCEYSNLLMGFIHNHVKLVEQFHISNPTEAEEFYSNQIQLGHEGMILRAMDAKYKHGRCTTKQDGMWKFKEFMTQDGILVDIEQQLRLRAGVERTTNVLGHLERRYEQDLYEPAGLVGAFVVQEARVDAEGEYTTGQTFKVKPGKGMNAAEKQRIWQDFSQYPEKWRGKHVEYKHMPHGSKDKPRLGSLVRFRPDLDV
ncbi:MAG: hypothetical protein KGL39_08455 [Patescibacteria group bacterium]|nr:hypothetical protein [Patescibacteria group bacterium]